MFMSKVIAPILGLALVANAVPATSQIKIPRGSPAVVKRGPDCSNLAFGLELEDCKHLKTIGVADQGVNSKTNNGNIWVGKDGPYTFTFTNTAGEAGEKDIPVTLVMWHFPLGDYQASFVNARRPAISFSLPKYNDTITVSAASEISGGWAALNNRETKLSPFGQIDNTWGEFTTGGWATADVSRLINMEGSNMEIVVPGNGCVSNLEKCSFHCKDGKTCGESGTYDLLSCAANSQPGASIGSYDGFNPEGGCQGWGSDGHLDIALGK